MVDSAGRPTPLRDTARTVSLITGGIGAVVTFLITSGVITEGQAGSLNAGFSGVDLLMAAVVAITTAGTGIAAAFSTARTGETHVTPVVNPMNNRNERLVPEAVDPTEKTLR